MAELLSQEVVAIGAKKSKVRTAPGQQRPKPAVSIYKNASSTAYGLNSHLMPLDSSKLAPWPKGQLMAR